ncbi:MAG TPA: alpha-amylase family protein [Kofleriaceae bacterium]|nr:alpha-amylase family protein [Kofleriaceae bacterium]
MEARRRTWFDERGLVISRSAPDTSGEEGGGAAGDRRLPFYAGAMHYWRVDPRHWEACLAQIHALGLTIVETYVPWRVHEPEPGVYSWSGPNDLGRFLALARAAGLSVVLRPGPHASAELTCFGMPDHVVGDPAVQARTARGTPAFLPSPPRAWPVPSYASAAFLGKVRGWYATVAEVVRPHLAPDGPVVALGVDNEAQLFFRLGAYDLDYHPDALAWWREATADEWPPDGVEPPRAWDPAAAARCAAWVRFKDQYIARALGALAALLDEVGLGGVARFHNLPPGHHGLSDVRRIQAAIGGPVGQGAYTRRADLRALRRRAAALVGDAAPIPIAFEVGVGFFPWFPPLDEGQDPDRERDQLLSLLAAGMRGFNLFMAVERERYYGAAIDAKGALAPHAAWIAPLVAALAEVDWPALRRRAAIALVDTRADARLGLATSLLDPATPVLAEALKLGPGGAAELGTDKGAVAVRRWQDALAGALELAQVPYAIVGEAVTEEELARYRAVVLPTIERVDRGLWHRVRAVVEARRSILVLGPGTPVRDELDQPLDEPPPRRIGRLKEGSLEDLPGLATDLAGIAAAGAPTGAHSLGDHPDAWLIERPEEVRAMAYVDARQVVRVVFVVSDAAKPASAVLLAGEAKQLRDPFTAERVRVTGGRATIALPPRGVRMFIVER